MAVYKNFSKLCAPLINNINFLFNSRFILPRYHQSQVTLCTRLDENTDVIPPRPKRPMNPFIKFSLEERSKVMKENPNMSAVQVICAVAKKWSDYDIEKKQNLQQIYRQEMNDYVQRAIDYENSLTDEQKELIKNARKKKLLMKQKINMKLKLQELGKPKRPPSGFFLFLKLNTDSQNGVRRSVWVKEMTEKWINLPLDVKEKFMDESKKLKEQYNSDILAWEEKMVQLGHTDLVRKGILLNLQDQADSK